MFDYKGVVISDNCKVWVDEYCIVVNKKKDSARKCLAFSNTKKNGEYGHKLLHRVIWENYWDTDIPSGCVVHHIDKNTFNNEIENLQCTPKYLHDLSHDRSGENNPMFGKDFSEEHRRKIGEFSKNRRWSDEVKKKIGDSQRGKIIPKDVRIKLSKANKGKKRSEEIKARMRQANRGEGNPMFGKKHSQETRDKISQGVRLHNQNKTRTE